MVWYAEASLWGINTEISECSIRSSIEILSAAHSRDPEVPGKLDLAISLINILGLTITVQHSFFEAKGHA
jgi:hypothetical protein